MSSTRRDFLKTVAGISLTVGTARAAPRNILSDQRMGVLVDTTVCIGCRRCEFACREAHGIPAGDLNDYDDRTVMEKMRRPDVDAFTVVNQYPNKNPNEPPVTVKVQCMHCDHPACVSACIVGAFSKEENGAVIWDESKCIGCRYCMIACPFQIPAFEYHKAIQPRVLKCDFCHERTSAGKLPACVDICPAEALIYGRRYELLELAHEKIRKNPDRYIDHVFGEFEVAGTSWLYLAGQDFASLGFPHLGNQAAPGATEPIQHAIFKYFIPPALLYALLGGIMWINRKQNAEEE